MSIFQMIYNIFIGPLELLFEVVFVAADRVINDPGYTIIVLSLVMNILVLPLYRRADALQAQEREVELKLKPGVDHIKKTFSGDERFMMLQTYYRQNGYKPTHALKGSISLLLEIPFFIAAYHFLSHLPDLSGKTLGPIGDLGAPDGLIQIGDVSVNLLPILMTLINLVSAAIYMRGMPLKNKIQMYGVAAIFLVLLYRSPSGLVFYWTLNNVFSLGKNISYKVKNSGRIIKFVKQIPLFDEIIRKHRHVERNPEGALASKESNRTFYFSVILLSVLSGFLIPSALIRGSATEFIDINMYYSPIWIIVSSLTIAIGTFLVWFVVFFKLASERGKYVISLLVLGVVVISLINYFFFGLKYGNISPQLKYDETPLITLESIVKNLLICGAAFILVAIVFRKRTALINIVLAVSIAAGLCMSFVNTTGIVHELNASNEVDQIKAASKVVPEFTMSSKGKNVVVMMMDRQLGILLPYILQENPDIRKSFDGFTYYSNTVSFGNFTNVGAPALYGGYDYTPENMNRRKDEKLVDKHNEALKVMPKVFSDEGYKVTVCDPPYAGYGWIPDLSVFSDVKNTKSFITYGKYPLDEFGYSISADLKRDTLFRDIFCYSLFKMSPDLLKPTIYHMGDYNNSQGSSYVQQTMSSNYQAHGFRQNFMEAYGVLHHLTDMTHISEKEENTFLMMSNVTTHEETLLQEPSYTPSMDVDNTRFEKGKYKGMRIDNRGNRLKLDDPHKTTHYHVNMATMLKLGEWLDYLKAHDLYDNSRIIIVSDHGRYFGESDVSYTDEKGKAIKMDTDWFMSTLMVKDFNEHGFKEDEHFVTNADTPAFALEDIVKNPVNPYNRRPIRRFDPTKMNADLIYTFDYETTKNNGNTFLPADWFRVKENVHDPANWEFIGHH